MNTKFKALALSAGLLAGLAASPAHAFVYADARLLINNLTITGAGLPAGVTNFTFTTTNSATLNGLSAFSTATCGGLPGAPGPTTNNCNAGNPTLTSAPANAPGSTVTRTPGNFSFFGPAGGQQFSNSLSTISQSELVGAASTSTQNITEAELQAAGSASATAAIQSITGFTFTFSITTPGTIALRFSANPDQFAQISEVMNGLFSAQSALSASFTLNQLTGGSGVATWAPRGTAANDCLAGGGLTCNEVFDSQNLNATIGTTTNNTSVALSHDGDGAFTLFGIDISGLTTGTYSLTLSESKQVQLSLTRVPEPASLLLLGIGVAALGLGSRRRQKKQAA